jgi:two-component system sensor histidine kinase KdpD
MKKKNRTTTTAFIFKIGRMAAVFAVMMLVAVLFQSFNLRQENTLMVFLTGILVIVIETGSYLFGFAASVLSVGVFNYFFVEPYHTFYISDINNVISLFIFLIVSSMYRQLQASLLPGCSSRYI